MRVQFGLFNKNGQPVGPGDLSKIAGDYGTFASEIAGEMIEGPVLMAYRGESITQEEDFEVQPVRSGPLSMTWDGRLDNRKELADRIRLRHIEDLSDPALVLKAYQGLGEPIFDELIGEFALVLWNRTTARLKFVRSACGARPLYYVSTKDSLTWSSDFAHLVRVSGVDLKLCDEYVLDYFVTEPHTSLTVLEGVLAALPNSVASFDKGQCSSIRELWDPTQVKPLSYRTDDDYELACREQIKKAVRVRLRSKAPICAELSGGLDSSTVVLNADKILRERNSPQGSLHTVSCVYNQSQTCDEYDFIFAVAQNRNFATHLVSEQDQRITLGLEEAPPFTGLPNPLHCLPGRYEAIAKIMREQGARVLLTGIGGDHLFLSDPDGALLVGDHLRKLNFRRAHQECVAWSQLTCVPYYKTARKGLRLLLDSLFPGEGDYISPEIPAWLNISNRPKRASRSVQFAEYKAWRGSPSQRARVFLVDRLFRVIGSGFLNQYPQLYISHPFAHRPLIEFCLATPVSQHLRDGHTRSLLRRSMANILPARTAKRVSKGLIDETIIRAVRLEWQSLGDLKSWQVCQRGYVNSSELEKTLNRARTGFLDLSGALFRLFSMERWLRSLSQVKQAAMNQQQFSIHRPSSAGFDFRLDFRSIRQAPEI